MPRLHVDPRDPTPLWRQIELAVQRLVASGALAAGSPLSSVRELAQELGINPATVSRAYQRLTEAGVLEVRRGEGTFVAGTPPVLAARDRERTLREAAERHAAVAVTVGADETETVRTLRAAFQALRGTRGGK